MWSFNKLAWLVSYVNLPVLLGSYLYQIAHLGDDDDEPEFSSNIPLEEGDTFFFAPRPLKNLVLVDEMESLSPVLACHIADLGGCRVLSFVLGVLTVHFPLFSEWRYASAVCPVR